MTSIGPPRATEVDRRHLLPFTVTVATSPLELAHAVQVRSAAYLRHLAPAADKLGVPEGDDARDDIILLIARSKLDGSMLGSIRIHPNFSYPMKFEGSVKLARSFEGKASVELMRLGVRNGLPGRLVTAALAKASYLICLAYDIDYIFVAGRAPVDLIYKAYRFDDLLGGEKVELSYAPGALHSILCLPVLEAEARWKAINGNIYKFMIGQDHPDIAIDYEEVSKRLLRPSKVYKGRNSAAIAVNLEDCV